MFTMHNYEKRAGYSKVIWSPYVCVDCVNPLQCMTWSPNVNIIFNGLFLSLCVTKETHSTSLLRNQQIISSTAFREPTAKHVLANGRGIEVPGVSILIIQDLLLCPSLDLSIATNKSMFPW